MGVGANCWNLIWVLVVYNFYKSYMHSHIICICTRVAAAAEEVVYEVVAEPQEPQGQAVGSRPKAHLTLVLSRRLKASPGAHSIILNYDTYIHNYYLCIRFRNGLEP